MAKNKSFNAAEDLNFVSPSAEKTINPAEKKKSEPKSPTDLESNDVFHEKEQDNVSANHTLNSISLFQHSRKENRSAKRTILIKQSTDNKLKKLSKKFGTSINDVINEILEQVLKEM